MARSVFSFLLSVNYICFLLFGLITLYNRVQAWKKTWFMYETWSGMSERYEQGNERSLEL